MYPHNWESRMAVKRVPLSYELNKSHIFNQRTGTCNYCVPVRIAYWYANVALFMLFPPAYQYASIPELNENLIFKQRTSTHLYFWHTSTPAYNSSCYFVDCTNMLKYAVILLGIPFLQRTSMLESLSHTN